MKCWCRLNLDRLNQRLRIFQRQRLSVSFTYQVVLPQKIYSIFKSIKNVIFFQPLDSKNNFFLHSLIQNNTDYAGIRLLK